MANFTHKINFMLINDNNYLHIKQKQNLVVIPSVAAIGEYGTYLSVFTDDLIPEIASLPKLTGLPDSNGYVHSVESELYKRVKRTEFTFSNRRRGRTEFKYSRKWKILSKNMQQWIM